jgi:hypothetical protein
MWNNYKVFKLKLKEFLSRHSFYTLDEYLNILVGKIDFIQVVFMYSNSLGARGSIVVKALGYKPEGRGFETRWGEWFLSIT